MGMEEKVEEKHKLQFVDLFEPNKQIVFVGTGVLDGPRITYTRQRTSAGRWRTVGDAGPYNCVFKPTDKPKFKILDSFYIQSLNSIYASTIPAKL